jgi:hypothetical protein
MRFLTEESEWEQEINWRERVIPIVVMANHSVNSFSKRLCFLHLLKKFLHICLWKEISEFMKADLKEPKDQQNDCGSLGIECSNNKLIVTHSHFRPQVVKYSFSKLGRRKFFLQKKWPQTLLILNPQKSKKRRHRKSYGTSKIKKNVKKFFNSVATF